MTDIGRITFGPNHRDPLRLSDEELRFVREPGYTVEHPPRRDREVQSTHHAECHEYHADCWPFDAQFAGGTSRFAAVQDEA